MSNITISGGFHNVAPMTLRLAENTISIWQYTKISRHICNIKGCVCGGRGLDVNGMNTRLFWDAMLDSSMAAEHARWSRRG